jgi:hypothetical protein
MAFFDGWSYVEDVFYHTTRVSRRTRQLVFNIHIREDESDIICFCIAKLNDIYRCANSIADVDEESDLFMVQNVRCCMR